MAEKPKIGFYWCSSCGGCEEAVVDIDEKILDVVEAVDIVFWPCAMDFKYADVEAMTDKEMAVCFINGAVQTSEQERMVKLLREKSGLIVAFGSCSSLGGVPSLGNLTNKTETFKRVYLDSPTNVNPDGALPDPEASLKGYNVELPEYYDSVYKLDDMIDVDYYLPGCAPTPKLIMASVLAILEGNLPEPGSVLLPDVALCASCDRNDSKPDNLKIAELKRIHEIVADPEICFLAQGVICMGPATRDGCEYLCINGNMPCSGCFGPVSDADQGAKMIGSLGGVLEGVEEETVREKVSQVVDPAGTFYRYSVSSSLLGGKRRKEA
jgi:F420-non-reducing hydrogenase small subunit